MQSGEIAQQAEPGPPEGFAPLFRSSPFLDLTGPFFFRKDSERKFVIGVRVAEKHMNMRETAHGGLLMTLLDIALGYCTAFTQNPPLPLATVSLSAEFMSAARLGDWVEAHVEVQKVGQKLAFSDAYLVVNGQRILRGSGVFSRPSTGALPGGQPPA